MKLKLKWLLTISIVCAISCSIPILLTSCSSTNTQQNASSSNNNENLGIKDAIKKSTFAKLKGRDNIFYRTDLLNKNHYGFVYPSLDSTRWNQNVRGGFLTQFANAFDFLFLSSNGEKNTDFKEAYDDRSIVTNINENQYKNVFGKTLSDIKKEYKSLENIKSVQIQFKIDPIGWSDYNGVGNHPCALYSLKYNLIYQTNDGSSDKIEDLYNGKKINALLITNIDEELFDYQNLSGKFVDLRKTDSYKNQDSNNEWNNMINNK